MTRELDGVAAPPMRNGAAVMVRGVRSRAAASSALTLRPGSGAPANGIRYQNNDGTDFGVNVLPDGSLRGLAWGANIGWISLNTAFGFVQTDRLTVSDSDGDGIGQVGRHVGLTVVIVSPSDYRPIAFERQTVKIPSANRHDVR